MCAATAEVRDTALHVADPDRYWLYEVYNNGRGELVVTASREQPR